MRPPRSDERPYRVEVARTMPVEASVAFAWVADPRTHPRFIPLTRIDGGPTAAPGVGHTFAMVSGPGARRGARGFIDRMVVTELVRPSGRTGAVGRTSVRKTGPTLLGTAGFDVVPLPEGRCRVVWWEQAYLAGPWPRRPNALLVGVVLRAMMHLSLRRLGRLLSRLG